MQKVMIIDAKRTAIGSFLGTLSNVHPRVYGATVVNHLIEKNQLNPADINELIIGNVLPAGLGMNLARQISVDAGIPTHVPAHAVNMVCGSGMKSVMNAFSNIALGLHDLVIAGGVESMSTAPYLLKDTRKGKKMGAPKMEDHMIDDALTDAFHHYHMGITAENIADRYEISREAQDEFAWDSQKRAIQAVDSGAFKDEIVPIEVALRKETVTFKDDEYPNRTTSREILSRLRPAFKKEGSVTAGNSSGLNDGASFLVLASEDYVNAHNLTPLAEIVATGQAGVDPSVMGLGPTPAIANALAMSQLSFEEMELIELNEAFASQSLGVLKELSDTYNTSIDALREKTNVNGGAIALGHPVGMSGNRILVTLLHALKHQNKKIGLASLCIGGGMGTATIVRMR